MYNIQNYVSDELTHFIGRDLKNDDKRFELMLKIIKSGVLKTKDWPDELLTVFSVDNSKSFSSNKLYTPFMVCFCDIPLTEMELHMSKYSRFGIAFHKSFLLDQGINPVNYIAQNSKLSNQSWVQLFDDMVKKTTDLTRKFEDMANTDEEKENINRIRFFLEQYLFSFIKFYDASKNENDIENYYMEREWRSIRKINFALFDIFRVILPVQYVHEFFEEIPDYRGHITTLK